MVARSEGSGTRDAAALTGCLLSAVSLGVKFFPLFGSLWRKPHDFTLPSIAIAFLLFGGCGMNAAERVGGIERQSAVCSESRDPGTALAQRAPASGKSRDSAVDLHAGINGFYQEKQQLLATDVPVFDLYPGENCGRATAHEAAPVQAPLSRASDAGIRLEDW